MHPSMMIRGMIARLGIRPYPLSLTYEVTWLCNLACAYCDRHTPMPSEMTRDQIFKALEEFHDLGMQQTNLDGGDPLVHRHIDEIVEWLVQREIAVSMHTNGILVPKKIDAMRGTGSFDRAIDGAKAAQDVGIPVEFTCIVGRHNADAIESLMEIAADLKIPVVFQPALNSLFLETARDGSPWQLDVQSIRVAFARIEQFKRRGAVVGNAWSSLRHFRSFPEDTTPPCAAGWVMATMDPEGALFPCGQVNRGDRSNNVVRL